jgi:plastocyanin
LVFDLRQNAILPPVKWAVKFLTLALASPLGFAASVTVNAKDPLGNPLQDVVVWAIPKEGPVPARARPAMVEQRNKTFIPLVTVVQAGTLVQFPNRDEIRHHVYSFSPAKRFEIKLYAGTPVDPVLFDKAGEVTLGCNIHDHMIAYIYVVDSPWFAKTDKDGVARIEGLPGGEFDVSAWYYAQDARPAPVGVKLRGDEAGTAAFTVGRRAMPPRPTAK